MAFRIYHSSTFDKLLEKCEKNFRVWLDKIEDQLVDNPYAGDPLGVRWFREKKYGIYRVYFLIYEEYQTVFMVNMSEKKDQQKIINTIRLLLDVYQDEIKHLIENNPPT